MTGAKSKRAGYSTPVQIVGWLLAIFVPIFSFLLSNKFYPLENGNSKIFWEIPLCTYLACIIIFLFLRKTFLQTVIFTFLTSIFASAFALACFFALNASLDQSAPIIKDYTITDKYWARGKGGGYFFKVRNDTEQKTILDLPPDLYNKGQIGGPFQRVIGKGFFDQPWIKEEKIP